MRIRTIKPEYWQHRMHKRLSVSASLLAAALLDYADDEGRFEAEGARIRGILVPNIKLEKPIEELLRELEALDWLVLYTVTLEGVEVEVGQICAFELHQAIDGKSKSLLPRPPAPWRQKLVWVRRGKRMVQMPKWVKTPMVEDESGEAAGSIGDQSAIDGSTEEGSIAGQSWGNEGKGRERKGKEGSVRAPADDQSSSSDSESSPSANKEKNAVSNFSSSNEGAKMDEAHEPTEAEVVSAAEMQGIDVEYARKFWRNMTNHHGWIKNRRLVKWRNILAERWVEDRDAWIAKNKNGGPLGTAAPTWQRVKELRAAMAEHPANRQGACYQPRCSAVQRAQFAELERELAALEKGGAFPVEQKAA